MSTIIEQLKANSRSFNEWTTAIDEDNKVKTIIYRIRSVATFADQKQGARFVNHRVDKYQNQPYSEATYVILSQMINKKAKEVEFYIQAWAHKDRQIEDAEFEITVHPLTEIS